MDENSSKIWNQLQKFLFYVFDHRLKTPLPHTTPPQNKKKKNPVLRLASKHQLVHIHVTWMDIEKKKAKIPDS